MISFLKDFPLSAKTLLNTNRQTVNVETMSNDEYLYIGIQKYVLYNTANIFKNLEEILLYIGSNRVLWPILGAISNLPNVTPFMIACFSGFEKPDNTNSFMANFCAEVRLLKENGIKVGQNQSLKKFNVRLFSCDTTAFVTRVFSHNGKHGCPKCCQEGTYKYRRVCFSKQVGSHRTGLTSPSHHIDDFKTKKSIMEESGFGMISQFPLDSMHLVDLGVTKQLLKLLVKKSDIKKINEKINYIAQFIPLEFGRIVRSLDEINHWKSTEFRPFFYTLEYIF